MNHTVSYGIDFAVALYAAFVGIGEDVEDSFYGTLMVGETEFEGGFGAVFAFVFEETTGEANFFYSTFGHNVGFSAFEVDEFIFYGA